MWIHPSTNRGSAKPFIHKKYCTQIFICRCPTHNAENRLKKDHRPVKNTSDADSLALIGVRDKTQKTYLRKRINSVWAMVRGPGRKWG